MSHLDEWLSTTKLHCVLMLNQTADCELSTDWEPWVVLVLNNWTDEGQPGLLAVLAPPGAHLILSIVTK